MHYQQLRARDVAHVQMRRNKVMERSAASLENGFGTTQTHGMKILSCIWTIVADRPISLTFSEFSVGATNGYAYGHGDYLNIYTCTSAACSSSTLAASFTALSGPSTTLLTSIIIRLHFITDIYAGDTGWVLQWSIVSLAVVNMYNKGLDGAPFATPPSSRTFSSGSPKP